MFTEAFEAARHAALMAYVHACENGGDWKAVADMMAEVLRDTGFIDHRDYLENEQGEV